MLSLQKLFIIASGNGLTSTQHQTNTWTSANLLSTGPLITNSSEILIKQDRRWNADKPSAALDPYMPTWLTTSPANHRPANFDFFLNIEMKLWKVVQPQVQLMSINIKFEVPILWLFQEQIITNIIY